MSWIARVVMIVLGMLSVYRSWSIGTYSSQPGWMPLIWMLIAGLCWFIAMALALHENREQLQQHIPAWKVRLGSSTALFAAFLLPWIMLAMLLQFVGMP